MKNYANLSLDDGSLLTDQEQFVIDQVSKGELADLVLEFGVNTKIRQLRSHFLEKLLTKGFDNIKVHRIGIRIKNAAFLESLDLENAIISYFVSLTYCIFVRKVKLLDTHFEKSLSVTGSIFLKEAYFHRVKVEMSFFIKKAIFEQSINLGGGFIGRNLEARDTCFNGKAIFNSMKVGQSVDFINSKFKDFVDLVYIKASNMFILGTKDNYIKIGKIALRNASFDRELELRFVDINILNLKDLQITGPLKLNNVHINEKIDLSSANLYSFKMDNVSLPNKDDSVIIDGLIYRFISAGKDRDDWRKLIEFVEISNFNVQNYNRLEAFFKTNGQQEIADEVYVKGKRRELCNQKWWHPKRLVTWLLWDKLTNYGRKPGRTILVSFFIIILGAFFFDPKLLKPEFLLSCPWLSSGNYYQNIIIRLILSLNNFLPAIDLGLTKELQLSNISFYTFIYLQFHKICGWILIPIGLAAIYTKIK